MKNSEMINLGNIREWAEEHRPREKLLKRGKKSLSNHELMSILIGSGSSKSNAVDLCKEILNYVNNDLLQLGKMKVNDFKRFHGIGTAKALVIVAALELGRRRQSENVAEIQKITCSRDIYKLFLGDLSDLNHEEFWVLYLNRANVILGKEKISSGGISGTVADSRIILKHAIERLASAIILVHNHPSGNLNPSKSDVLLTEKLRDGGALLDILVLDHLIVSGTGYYSFADEGMM